MEIPSSQIKKIFKETNEKEKELFKYIFEKSDSIILWIIGLSVGGIAIIANDFGNVKNNIPSKFLHPILICLVTSVITGIIYRISFLWLVLHNAQSTTAIEFELTEHKIMDTKSYLKGDEDFSELIYMIKTGFGYDYNKIIEQYDKSDEGGKKHLYNEFVNIYNKNVEWAKTDAEYGFQTAIEIYAKYTGQSVEKFKKNYEENDIGKKLRINIILLWLIGLIFFLSFFATLILFVLSA